MGKGTQMHSEPQTGWSPGVPPPLPRTLILQTQLLFPSLCALLPAETALRENRNSGASVSCGRRAAGAQAEPQRGAEKREAGWLHAP